MKQEPVAESPAFLRWEAEMKRKVHRIKTATGIRTGHCYERLAKTDGFNNYAALRAHMKKALAGAE